jgi:hypothetical protein
VNDDLSLLRVEIVRAAIRHRRTRQQWRRAVAVFAVTGIVCGLIAVVIGALVGPDSEPRDTSAVTVKRTQDSVVIDVVDSSHPDKVIADLRSVGVTVKRVERTTGPSKVGTVVSLMPEGVPATSTKDHELVVPLHVPTLVLVGVGVPAQRGMLYDVGTDAFALGEPFWCRSWQGQDSSSLASEIADDEVSVEVIDHAVGPVDDVPSGKVVLSATAVAADRVIVTIGDPGANTSTSAPPAACIASSRTSRH